MDEYIIFDKMIKANIYRLFNEILKSSKDLELDKAKDKLEEIEKFLILHFWINLYFTAETDFERELVARIIAYYKNDNSQK